MPMSELLVCERWRLLELLFLGARLLRVLIVNIRMLGLLLLLLLGRLPVLMVLLLLPRQLARSPLKRRRLGVV